MSRKVLMFDNGCMFYMYGTYVTDKDGVYLASLTDTLNELSLDVNEMSELQIWTLCEPIIKAYERGVSNAQKKMTQKLLQLFELKEE